MEYKFLSPAEVQKAIKNYFETSEEVREQIKMFEVFAYPDTNEGRYLAKAQGFVLVRFNSKASSASHDTKHEDFVSDFVYRAYGNQMTYGMGNYLVRSWRYKTISNRRKNSLLKSILEKPDTEDILPSLHRDILLGVIEPLNIYDTIWSKFDFYRKLGWRRG